MKTGHYVDWIKNGEAHKVRCDSEADAKRQFLHLKGLAGVSEVEWRKRHIEGWESIDYWQPKGHLPRTGRRADADSKPPQQARSVDPESAYEAAHNTAHVLVQRLTEVLHNLPAPNSGYANWHHLDVMVDVQRSLMSVIKFVESET